MASSIASFLILALVALAHISNSSAFQNIARPVTTKSAHTLRSTVEEQEQFSVLSGLDKYFEKTDQYKENSQPYRRNVFGHPEWRKHRSSKRYWKNLTTTFSSGVIQGLLLEVLTVAAVATGVVGYNAWVGNELPFLAAPEGLPLGKAVLPSLPFNLSSSALGLLLVFRTNSAYGRWWEARIQWGFTINRCRDVVRNGLCFFNSKDGYRRTPEMVAMKTRFTMLSIAYARALKGQFREGPAEELKLRGEFEKLLGKEDADYIMSAKHRPLRIVQEMSSMVKKANMDEVLMFNIDKSLAGFCDSIGVCERIFKTPMPLVYTRHTSRFLSMWLLFLPFALYKDLGDSFLHLATIPASALIAVFFLGIEELGIQIEEPFSVLPMEAMCDGIEGSCKEALANDLALSEPVAAPASTVDEKQAVAMK